MQYNIALCHLCCDGPQLYMFYDKFASNARQEQYQFYWTLAYEISFIFHCVVTELTVAWYFLKHLLQTIHMHLAVLFGSIGFEGLQKLKLHNTHTKSVLLHNVVLTH